MTDKFPKDEMYIVWEPQKEWKDKDPQTQQCLPFNPLLENEHKSNGCDIFIGANVTRAITLEDLEKELEGDEEIIENPDGSVSHTICNYREGSFYYTTGSLSDGVLRNKPKQHPLDRKYPHECYLCGDVLEWKGLIFANINCVTNYSQGYNFLVLGWLKKVKKYRQLKKLWRMKNVHFYCCGCFDENEALGECDK